LEHKKSYYPACVIAVLIVLLFGIGTICQIYLVKDSYPVDKLWVGADHVVIYNATKNLIDGDSLYKNIWRSTPDYLKKLAVELNLVKWNDGEWYTQPPILAYINYPLICFDMKTASQLMFFILIAAVLCAFALISSSFESIPGKDREIIFLCGAMIILLSHPFYFLIVRGHLVGIVFLLLAMGIYLFKRNNPLSSVCFGLSIGMMIFPVLLLVPLLILRKYKIFIFTLLSLVALVLLCPGLWFEFLTGPAFARFSRPIMMADNGSLANTCVFCILFINKLFSYLGFPRFSVMHVDKIALIIYAAAFCAMAVADIQIRKKHSPLDQEVEMSLIMMYFPFMIAIPKNSYAYNLVLPVLLVPVLCSLMHKFKKPVPKIILWTLMTGIVLTQMQAHFLQNLIDIKPYFFYFFPAFGLFLVMIGCVLFKLWFWRMDAGGRGSI